MLKTCPNCAGRVPKPSKSNVKVKKFCSDNCRKEFHRNNGISVHKLKAQAQRWVHETMRPLEQLVSDLSKIVSDLSARVQLLEHPPVEIDADPRARSARRGSGVTAFFILAGVLFGLLIVWINFSVALPDLGAASWIEVLTR